LPFAFRSFSALLYFRPPLVVHFFDIFFENLHFAHVSPLLLKFVPLPSFVQAMANDNEIQKLFNPSSNMTSEDLEAAVSSASHRASSSHASSAADSTGSILGGARAGQEMVVYNNHSSSSGSGNSSTYASSYDWNKKATSGYVGLSNQGATCYMNSLIQSLFMTPEFRHALYEWSYDNWAEQSGWPEHQKKKVAAANGSAKEGDQPAPTEAVPENPEEFEKWKLEFEKKSIPRQLQKLFAHLQLADSRAVQTKSLTKSFGWTDADAFTQHDVQELCRLLFEALEKCWKGTKQENLINDLYQGKIKDYVKCSACGHESAREDKFLDVALAVKAFGAPKAVESVEEALQKFVEPEILNGSNQYFCEKCNTKVDAEKGLKFTSFPYILMLQLKRFDFDYETMRRIKLNDRVTFPQILDLNPFLRDTAAPAGAEAPAPAASSSASAADADGAMEVDTPVAATNGADDGEDKEAEGATEDDQENAKPAENQPKINPEAHLFDASKERVDSLLANGPAVYELFAILIHRGSANGGHYYAYIKNLTDGKWNEFNDSSVSSVDERTLAESFGESSSGGGRSYWASSSGTNAYMVVYRQVDSTRNVTVPPTEEIPEQVRNIIAEEERQKQEKEKQKQREREMVKFKVLYKDDKRTLRLHKSEPLSCLLDMAIQKFDDLKGFSHENMRLRDWNRYNDVAEKVIEDLTKRPDEQWAGTYNYGERTIVLETRENSSQEWFPVDSKQLLLQVFAFKGDNFPHQAEPLYVSKEATVSEIREALAAKFDIPAQQQILTVEPYSSNSSGTIVGTEHDNKTMEDAIGSICKWGMYVWIEPETPAPVDEKKPESTEGDQVETGAKILHRAPKHIKLMKNRVIIRFNHPDEPETKMDHVVYASGHEVVGLVRDRIAEALSLTADDFIIQKRVRAYYGSRYRYEEVNTDDVKVSKLLSMYNSKIAEPTRVKVVLKRGKPARRGEALVGLQMMHSYPEWADDSAWEKLKLIEPLGDVLLPSSATLEEIRVFAVKMLKEKGIIPADEEFSPDRIRFRDVSSSGLPSRIMSDPADKPLMYKYGAPKLTLQILPHAEVKTPKSQVLFVQRWCPDEFKTGNVEEIAFADGTAWSEVARIISEKYGVANVGVHKEWMMSAGRSLKQIEAYEFAIPDTTITSSRMDDGDWVFWRDMDAQPKELKQDEKDLLIKQDSKKREKLAFQSTMSSNYSMREKDLKIKQEEV
jgi:ubiquitin C-terminal hydrolase